MKRNLAGLLFGAGFGFVMAWAYLSHSDVIRDMLMLRDAHVFLLMCASVAVSGIGSRVLRAMKVQAPLAGESIDWDLVRPEKRHLIGSVLFGIGWATAGTCPGPAAVAIGEGRLAGLAIVAGMIVGVLLQGARAKRRLVEATRPTMEPARAAGL
jgi:uncharacterized membrane protein YedE/YeeE